MKRILWNGMKARQHGSRSYPTAWVEARRANPPNKHAILCYNRNFREAGAKAPPVPANHGQGRKEYPMKLELEKEARLALKKLAHNTETTIYIGKNGVTNPVLHEIDNALRVSGLIKIQLGTDRDERKVWAEEICDKLGAAFIQMVGKQLVIYRKPEEKDKNGD